MAGLTLKNIYKKYPGGFVLVKVRILPSCRTFRMRKVNNTSYDRWS